MDNGSMVLDIAATDSRTPVDPRAYLRILWRRKFLLLLFLAAIPVATYLYESSRPKVYRSSALLEVSGNQATVSSLFNPSPQGGTPNLDLQARLVSTPALARKAALFLHPRPRHPRSLIPDVSAAGDPSTGFLTITASASSAQLAANVANAFAHAVVLQGVQGARTALNAAISQLQAQLKGIPASNPGRLQIASQLAQFRALRSVPQQGNAQIINLAGPNPTPVSPRLTRAVILAVIVGLLLGLGAVALVDAADRRLRDADEVDRLVGVPLLGAVPTSAFSPHPSHDAEEAFATLRAALTYFNVDRQMTSVLVTSAHQEEGKTTVSIGLARALARAGRDVILVDTDMRRPAAASRVGLHQGPGLGGVLIDEIPLDEAMLEVEGEDFRGRLRILPAGHPPPNPSELLGSRRMQQLLSELAERSNMVVIDSTPLLTVSDPMPLVRVVSGVVLIARMNRTSRDAIVKLRQVVTAAGGHPLGVVTTGAPGAGLYVGPGYGYGYSDSYRNGYTYAAATTKNGKNGASRGGLWRRITERDRTVVRSDRD